MLDKLKALMQKSEPATINVNGRTYIGRNLTITDDRVFIDGKPVDVEEKQITVSIVGNVVNLHSSAEVSVIGDVGEIVSSSGSIMCHDVKGGIQTTSGNVSCCDVYADISTRSGNVTASEIHGAVKTVTGNISA